MKKNLCIGAIFKIKNINRFMKKWRLKHKRDNYIFAENG